MDTVKLKSAKDPITQLILVLSVWSPKNADYTEILKEVSAATTIDELNNSLADAWDLFFNE